MERIKRLNLGLLTVFVILPLITLLVACGETYKIDYGTYKVVQYKAINSVTNETMFYGVDDKLPVAVKFTSDLTLNEDGTVGDCAIINSFTIDSKGNVQFYFNGEESFTAYFEGDVMYLYYGKIKSSEDIKNEVPDDEATFYTMYAVYTLNGVELPAEDNTNNE